MSTRPLPRQLSPPVGWHVGAFQSADAPKLPGLCLTPRGLVVTSGPGGASLPSCFSLSFRMEGEGQRDGEETSAGFQHGTLPAPGALRTLAGLKGTTEVSKMFRTPENHRSALVQHGSCPDIADVTQREPRKLGFLCFLHGQELWQKLNEGRRLLLVP